MLLSRELSSQFISLFFFVPVAIQCIAATYGLENESENKKYSTKATLEVRSGRTVVHQPFLCAFQFFHTLGIILQTGGGVCSNDRS